MKSIGSARGKKVEARTAGLIAEERCPTPAGGFAQ
jgi:hypothetical protein